MVSVIIPVYNTEPFLEECLKSVTSQTYEDLEIIVINDGSTDGSGEICKRWKKKDSRICYMEKENQGQGAARNLGVTLATGDYIIFVDSDDYVDKQLVEKVYNRISREKADLCVYANYSVGTEKRRALLDFKLFHGNSTQDNKGLLGNMIPILCNKMFAKELIKNSGITMSNRMCEDLVFNARLYVRAKRICMLDEPLYYYRYNREGNMTTKYDRYFEVEESMNELNESFQRDGIFDLNWPGLYELSFNMLKDILLRINKRTDLNLPEKIRANYPVFWKKYRNFLDRWFSSYVDTKMQQKNYLLIGSYSLRVLIRVLLLNEEYLRKDYGSSSIVSIMSDSGGKVIPWKSYEFKNEYRKRCVEQDIKKSFQHKTQWEGFDYIVVDLLEETADLIEIQDGCYITDSEFFQEVCGRQFGSYNKIPFLCEKRRELFIQSVNRFAEKIKEFGIPVIVVKNFLCERHSIYYDTFTDYKNAEQIRKTNCELEWCYNQLMDCLSDRLEADVVVADAFGFEELMFTHSDFPFGRQPKYYNNGYYQRMAIRIGECVHHKKAGGVYRNDAGACV